MNVKFECVYKQMHTHVNSLPLSTLCELTSVVKESTLMGEYTYVLHEGELGDRCLHVAKWVRNYATFNKL